MGKSSLQTSEPTYYKSCDECRARKVRCMGSSAPDPCKVCLRRNQPCHFSVVRKRHKSDTKVPPGVYTVAGEDSERSKSLLSRITDSNQESEVGRINQSSSLVDDSSKHRPHVVPDKPVEKDARIPTLYVDRLLYKNTSITHSQERDFFPFTGNGIFAGSFSLTFFSESRMDTLSASLGNTKVNYLVNKIAEVLRTRLQQIPQIGGLSILRRQPQMTHLGPSETQAAHYICAYFERVHPFSPFLDRMEFERHAKDSSPDCCSDKAWSALYYCVLALGCQYSGGGSFITGQGEAWQYFSVSLSLFPDLLTCEDSLPVLQAIAAMAIFSLSVSGLQVEHIIISEGGRRAQRMANKERLNPTDAYSRTFWVLYALEKTSSFYSGRSSVFYDFDIFQPVQPKLGLLIEGFDWFLASVQHARLLSRAYMSLFSVGVVGNTPHYFEQTIDQLEAELEIWRNTIPDQIRPGTKFRAHILTLPQAVTGVLWLHYLYYGLRLALSRAKLLLQNLFQESGTIFDQHETKREIMRTSRLILELTKFVDVEPYTNLWILAGIPISALFVLFDLVIHNPKHTETATNLALLDIAGGHFSSIEYASGGILPGSLIAEFSHIAREYVNKGTMSRQALPIKSPSFHGSSSKPPALADVGEPANLDELVTEAKWQDIGTDELLTQALSADTLDYPLDFSQHDFSVDFPLGTDILDLFHCGGFSMSSGFGNI